MSSYIIAGSADSLDTAYCEQLARRIKAKYKNIDFRVVIKHPSEWEDYLNQICRIYGFLKKSNPIIYTYHGKIIGNKDAFVSNTVKYFGLNEESLIVKDLSTAVNIKLANQELQKKKAMKGNIKTLPQKIKLTYDKLLKQGVLTHQFKTKAQFLVNGIEYYFRQVPGICPPISFPQNFSIPVQTQNIAASNINLMQLSLQDQITPQQTGKQPFVTNQANQVLNTESMQRMSEASRTNKLQSSVMSKDEDSKINKQSNKEKHKIDEEFDDVADFNNVNMEPLVIAELGDHFYLAFQNKTHVSGEMVMYHNQGHANGNFMRVYNDRPVIGHHTIIKEIHYIGEPQFQEATENIIKENQQQQENDKEKEQVNLQEKQKQKQQIDDSHSNPAEKSKTEPNIPASTAAVQKKPYPEQQALSQPCSDLNLVSNLNYHTLYILKPLSNLQLRYLLNLLRQTNTVVCFQFLPQNSNPKIKVYNRGMLLGTCDSLFPVQNFINKQIQDGEVENVVLPRDWEEHNEQYKINVKRINQIGFSHLYFEHHDKLGEEELSKNLKIMIDEILFLEQGLKKQIGYNLIMTKKFTLVVALTEPYKIFGSNPMYFDGLAYLGFVQVAKVLEGYKLKEEKIEEGHSIRQALARCSGFKLGD